jgi:hypothetical protein
MWLRRSPSVSESVWGDHCQTVPVAMMPLPVRQPESVLSESVPPALALPVALKSG